MKTVCTDSSASVLRAISCLGVLIGAVPVVEADAPPLVPLQGFLTERDGRVLQGQVQLRLALYTQAQGGSPVFEESQRVQVEDGHFSAYLGDVEDLSLDLFREMTTLFVGVTVSGDSEISPRMQLATAPYAAFAATCGEASSVGGIPARDLARTTHQHSAADLGSGVISVERYDAYADLSSEQRLGGDDPDDLLTVAGGDARYAPGTSRAIEAGFSDPLLLDNEAVTIPSQTVVEVASAKIQTAGPGFVLAIGTVTAGTLAPQGSALWLGLSNGSRSAGSHTMVPAASINESTVHGVFPVSSSGTQTFSLTALLAAAEGGRSSGAQLSLVFVPARE